jgi:hypothetical protein
MIERSENISPMTGGERFWWRIALELKLRKSSGDAFQDFFCQVMTKAHGNDFVRVRPFGQLGDHGCDGYLDSTGHIYQCYGALNGDAGKVAYLLSKMEDDFAKATGGALGAIMKAWSMVHNLVDGLPVEAIEKLETLRKTAGERKLSFLSI